MTDDLEDLEKVGPSTADSLMEGGYSTKQSIAVASASEIAERADVGESTANAIIRSARKQADIGGFKSGSDVAERESERKDLSLFPSTEDAELSESEEEFRELLDTGIKTHSITEFSGRPGSGKTQNMHQLAVNVQLPESVGGLNGRPIYIDTEDTFSTKRIESMVRGLEDGVQEAAMEVRGIEADADNEESVDALVESMLNGMVVSKAQTSNHQILMTEEAKTLADNHNNQLEDVSEDADHVDKMPYKLLIIDSLTTHFRSEYVGRGQLAERQQKLNKNLRIIGNFAKSQDAIAAYANQVQADPQGHQWGGPQTVGGNVVGHKKDYEIRVKPSKKNRIILKLQKAPDLPNGEVTVKIVEEGVKPA